MRRDKRVVAFMAMVASLTLASPAVASEYAGWQTSSYWRGIHGNLRQTTTSSVPAGKAHFVFINLCTTGCAEWVQTGTLQGSFTGGSSPDIVKVYYENKTACGYYKDTLSPPPTATYHYYLHYDSNGSFLYDCNGSQRLGYTFLFKKGSYGSTPFYYGTLSTVSGLAFAKTETASSPPLLTDYFGCSPTLNCSDSASEMRLWDGSLWHTWTSSLAPSVSSQSNPPHLHTYHSYYAFKSCPVAC